MANTTMPTRRLIVILMGVGIVARLVPHPWNATPTTAIALFGGASLPRRWGVLLPLAVVAVSDVFLGWHATIPFTWGAFALTAMLGWWLRHSPSVGRIAAASLAGSLLFFVLTNFGVWVTGELYPRTTGGLWQCYAAAVPFFRNTLLGDLAWTTLLFGAVAIAASLRSARQPARSG